MLQNFRHIVFVWMAIIGTGAIGLADEKANSPPMSCAARASDFENEVWTKVGVAKCLTCHRKGGDAGDSAFVLTDLNRTALTARGEAMQLNRAAFARVAAMKEGDQSRMLLKVTGQLEHGGGEVLMRDSSGYRVLAEFVRRANGKESGTVSATPVDPLLPPFFDGVVMLDDRRQLRRVTLSLAGRLPTEAEFAAIAKDGRQSMPAILDGVMKEESFYDRLREGFNDVFLTLGIDGNADATVLAYEHFEKTRLWYQHYDLSHIADKNERQRAEWKIAGEYRQALLGEPMKLIEHIVRNDRPFTEIVTADYIMVTPYSARGYGVFEELKDQFKNPDDPFEYVPVKLKALVGRNKSENQDS